MKSEQIFNNLIILDEDATLTPKEIETILNRYVKVKKRVNSEFLIEFNNQEYLFLIKNITYLGNPHLLFKKRIQISKGWHSKLQLKNCFLFGIYSYKDTLIFVNFDKTNYKNRMVNNSSAHIYSIDLLKAKEFGYFEKNDKRNNKIIAIREDKFIEFLSNKITQNSEIEMFKDFKYTLKKEWFGIDCYQEMIKENYKNKFQPEWVGFYFEFQFEKFLNQNSSYKSMCDFLHNKKKNDIDLDLFFKRNNFYGDLKTHSLDSNAILGNDKKNIEIAIKKYGKLWYIVLNHFTIKDKDKEFEVTKFWNLEQKKENLMSYSKRMKNSVILSNLEILEINEFNFKYLTDFNQGKNSNGNDRDVKIKINNKVKDNFLIFNEKF